MKAKGVQVDLINVGRKGNDYFRRRQVQIVEKFINVMNQVSYELGGTNCFTWPLRKFNLGEYQEVYLLYNSFPYGRYPDCDI